MQIDLTSDYPLKKPTGKGDQEARRGRGRGAGAASGGRRGGGAGSTNNSQPSVAYMNSVGRGTKRLRERKLKKSPKGEVGAQTGDGNGSGSSSPSNKKPAAAAAASRKGKGIVTVEPPAMDQQASFWTKYVE